MVDLPTGKTLMRKLKKQRKYIDPDAFYLARRQAGLTVLEAAIELNVSERTIRNYENGAVTIPYPSFRLMRLLGGYALVAVSKRLGDDWQDWSFWQNKLWSPEGKGFDVQNLRYLSTYMQIARRALASSRARPSATAAKRQVKGVVSLVHGTAAREQPSSATALFGVEVAQSPIVYVETLLADRGMAA